MASPFLSRVPLSNTTNNFTSISFSFSLSTSPLPSFLGISLQTPTAENPDRSIEDQGDLHAGSQLHHDRGQDHFGFVVGCGGGGGVVVVDDDDDGDGCDESEKLR
uniref:Uncharacterized protein n=1 Tax=Fagus sylvatica TaxID=28930 RepID=A0A2N9GC69_FAGSY